MRHLRFLTLPASLLSLIALILTPCQTLASTSLSGPGVSVSEQERINREQIRRESSEYQEYLAQAALTLPVLTFDVNRFVLPSDAGLLIVVEGTSGSSCDVYVYEKSVGGWQQLMAVPGHLGSNGMNSHRTVGDRTTPIGVFKLNTPFGQASPKEGFPQNYIQVDSSYVWTDDTNRLEKDSQLSGEQVGTSRYQDYYDYVLDMGFNPEAIPNQGSALFIHCEGDYWVSSAGCVSIPREQMEEIMKLYGTWGDSRCFIALAPGGSFDTIYDTYGTNHGLSPADS